MRRWLLATNDYSNENGDDSFSPSQVFKSPAPVPMKQGDATPTGDDCREIDPEDIVKDKLDWD